MRPVKVKFAGFVTAVILSAAACNRSKTGGGPINTQLTRKADVTGDGQPETITLQLKAGNYKAPFLWTLAIDSGGNTIFEHDSDDSDVDEVFADRDAMPRCPDYASCKEQYYFHDLLDQLIVQEYDVDTLLDVSDGKSLYHVGRGHLRDCCNLFGPPADRVLKNVADRLRGGRAAVISVPATPVDAGPLLVYAPEVGQFVPVYEP
jgi:hypothetical protein